MHKMSAKHNNRHSHFDLKGDLDNIKEALADAGEDVRGRLGEILAQSMQDVKDRSLSASETVTDYVAEKPLKSLGIALVSGFIIGFLLRR